MKSVRSNTRTFQKPNFRDRPYLSLEKSQIKLFGNQHLLVTYLRKIFQKSTQKFYRTRSLKVGKPTENLQNALIFSMKGEENFWYSRFACLIKLDENFQTTKLYCKLNFFGCLI